MNFRSSTTEILSSSYLKDVAHHQKNRQMSSGLLLCTSQGGEQLIRDTFLFQMPRIRGSDVAAGQVSMLLCCVSC